ncbi:DUF1642 domain-containing protein [Streptococcus thermophilus]|uniref:DUF1642 domain-containing protein n=1 Tax=Streptococcus thermophilus TaxID=1308 RepID=UPI0022FEA7C0|nr:DUF1642 domain-containing protein [Streptococcus thermophilus]MDA5537989.1 DUF1642 domain-containing protein [Streptococcus thermophilus]MDA5552498.1 DUF1642 domain-containing protein [Streptococcus thermophilus]WCL60761.1 DUF1642 domain-containing protein [Streptococcus thermophilus]
MTKDEAVKKIAREGYISIEHAEELYDSIINKPVVPQYVVDWVDKSRKYDYDFEEWFDCINQSHDVYEWLNCGNKRKAELNALAFATLIVNGSDAVIVEKEPKYLVKVKGIDGYYAYLGKELRTSKWIFGTIDNFANHRTHHTLKELEEAGFGWVFDCEGVEVIEVE